MKYMQSQIVHQLLQSMLQKDMACSIYLSRRLGTFQFYMECMYRTIAQGMHSSTNTDQEDRYTTAHLDSIVQDILLLCMLYIRLLNWLQ